MYKIKVEIKGEIVDEFESSGENTILHDAIFSDVDLDYSCQTGLCQICNCKFEGDVDILLDSMVDDTILTCKTKAKSDLVLKFDR